MDLLAAGDDHIVGPTLQGEPPVGVHPPRSPVNTMPPDPIAIGAVGAAVERGAGEYVDPADLALLHGPPAGRGSLNLHPDKRSTGGRWIDAQVAQGLATVAKAASVEP